MKTQYSKLLIVLLFLLATSCSKPLPAPPDYNITLYAATYAKGIYQTINGGESWYPLDMDQHPLDMYFKRIYLDPRNKNVIYVTTTGGGLFRINLLQLTLKNRASFSDENINSMAFLKRANPLPVSQPDRQSDLLLIGCENLGVFRTTNDHEVWQPFNKGLLFRDVRVLFTNGEDMYAGTGKDLFKYDNTSQQWNPISQGIQNKNIYSIGGDSEGKVLYAGSGAYEGAKGYFQRIPCLYKSSNQGKTWTASDKGIPEGTLIYTIAVNQKKPERIYLGTSKGIYSSTDSGKTWAKMKHGLPKNFRVLDIKIARMNDGKDIVYAAGNCGVYMTLDDDKTGWVGKSYGLPQTMITSILIAPNNGSGKLEAQSK